VRDLRCAADAPPLFIALASTDELAVKPSLALYRGEAPQR